MREALDATAAGMGRQEPVVYDPAAIAGLGERQRGVALDLSLLAEQALERGPYSVVEKRSVAPSGQLHDYWHPAPYWWPDDTKADGLPYVRRDGKRVPGTNFNDPESDLYDRVRLKAMFDDTTYLAIAARVHGEPRFAAHAAALVRTWFISPETAMTPHLHYAQVRMGHNGNQGPGSGIIEFRDLFYFLDAVRLLEGAGALTAADVAAFRGWLRAYADWLQSSKAGQRECRALNNHGTFFDVQLGAIAAYLGDRALADQICARLPQRIAEQFEPDGTQPQEVARADVRHYVCFNLYAWTSLARIVRAFGVDLWRMRDTEGRGLESAFAWLIRADARHRWSEAGNVMFRTHRMAPLWRDCHAHFPSLTGAPHPSDAALKRILYPNFDIVPLWGLTRV
ncbi:hypothetical protein FAZ78_13270 [Cereibacter changlensis]|uniref:Alginate lyase domain-containing protein n=1 Tax=Cereibacter changlensis TaxID=402884 RepID=A0A4V5NLM1_9RHOB|nr:alginate lyase family protein [Cereibacter changlensis]TKA96107.1 hypothetical protein FAZ78_13270 [Cereibacter changlensis]